MNELVVLIFLSFAHKQHPYTAKFAKCKIQFHFSKSVSV